MSAEELKTEIKATLASLADAAQNADIETEDAFEVAHRIAALNAELAALAGKLGAKSFVRR